MTQTQTDETKSVLVLFAFNKSVCTDSVDFKLIEHIYRLVYHIDFFYELDELLIVAEKCRNILRGGEQHFTKV